jgi:sugar diacid utilization regulator
VQDDKAEGAVTASSTEGPAARSPEHAALVAFRSVTSALAEERDLDAVFHPVVDTLAALTGATRCSLHLLDRETGLLHGQAAHAASDIDAMVQKLVSGLPGDDFTREILETRRPVLLSDTAVDPRPVPSAMRRWRVRSVLGVPMVLRGEVIGIVCLDREDAPMEVSEFDQELAISFAELAATAINQVQLTAELRQSLQTQARQLELLQRAHQMEGRLTDALLRGRGVGEAAEVVEELLGKPCAVYDGALRRLTRGSGTDALPKSLDELRGPSDEADLFASLECGSTSRIDGLPGGRRFLVAPIDVEAGRHGYVVVAGRVGARFGGLDEVILRRAAHSIALERSRRGFEDELEWQATEAFTGSLIRGEHADLAERARSLGVRLDVPRIVCLLGARKLGDPVGQVTPHVAARLMTDRESTSAVLAAWSGSDIALVVEVPAAQSGREAVTWVKDRLVRAIDRLGPAEFYGALSGMVREPTDDVRAHREADQVMRCIREHLSDPTEVALGATELGAARLLLATAGRAEAERMARDALGTLLEPDAKSAELLATLDAFVRNGRDVRHCADALGVHRNTVRYRLGNIERMTRLAVTTDEDDYLTAQLAVHVLRLHGLVPSGPQD